jgi:mRNA-degrading endonuclease RelE of RelBE toxin-antitoxin system
MAIRQFALKIPDTVCATLAHGSPRDAADEGATQGYPFRDSSRELCITIGLASRSPEQQGKPLSGGLAGFRSVRAVGPRYRIVYRVERREVTVLIVAIGRRRSGDKGDMYELAGKLLRARLIR